MVSLGDGVACGWVGGKGYLGGRGVAGFLVGGMCIYFMVLMIEIAWCSNESPYHVCFADSERNKENLRRSLSIAFVS